MSDALGAGAHVIVEKPVAPTNAQFRELWTLAQAKGRRVSRAAAQRHLDALLERVRLLKQDPHHLYRVHRLALPACALTR